MPRRAYDRQVKSVETRVGNLAARTWGHADADRLAARLGKYGDRLTTFLHDESVDETNNAAGRALRLAVIMRKVIGGIGSESVAEARTIPASVMRMAQQQGRDVVSTIKELLRASWAGKETPLLIDTTQKPGHRGKQLHQSRPEKSS